MRFAANTRVAPERSVGEIERTLRRYGATGFVYGWEENAAVVAFRMSERQIKFLIRMPDPKNDEIAKTARGRTRSDAARETVLAKAGRQRWRALLLVIKAKLEAVTSGIAEFDTEFLPYIVLADGSTVGERITPQIAEGYRLGKVPRLLLGMGDGAK